MPKHLVDSVYFIKTKKSIFYSFVQIILIINAPFFHKIQIFDIRYAQSFMRREGLNAYFFMQRFAATPITVSVMTAQIVASGLLSFDFFILYSFLSSASS